MFSYPVAQFIPRFFLLLCYVVGVVFPLLTGHLAVSPCVQYTLRSSLLILHRRCVDNIMLFTTHASAFM